MSRPRLLDLFCGAGGCSVGYERAGFEVVGVDLVRQWHYPFEFHAANALTFPLDGFDVVHASPPCKRYSSMTRATTSNFPQLFDPNPDLLDPMRQRLLDAGVPYVIENVVGSPVRPDVTLCGSMFGLEVRRHRLFECSVPLELDPPPCDHSGKIVGVYGNPQGAAGAWPSMLPGDVETWQRAMGIDWTDDPKGIAQAIPPAYTQWLGERLLAAMSAAA